MLSITNITNIRMTSFNEILVCVIKLKTKTIDVAYVCIKNKLMGKEDLLNYVPRNLVVFIYIMIYKSGHKLNNV